MAIIIPPVDRMATDVSTLFRWHTTRRVMVDLASPWIESDRMRRVFRGFAKLASLGFAPQDCAVIGAGSGVEAIAASQILSTIERLTLIDRDPVTLARATANVAGNVDRAIELETLIAGTPMAVTRIGLRADLVYADLLAIAADPAVTPARSGVSRRPGQMTEDEWLDRCNLALARQFLAALPGLLRCGGTALVVLAGRVGYPALERLAVAADLRFEPLVSGFTPQSDPAAMLSCYATEETAGIEFEFYDFHAAKHRLRQGDDRAGPEFDAMLAPWRVSAAEALTACRAGSVIGHTYHVLKAVPC